MMKNHEVSSPATADIQPYVEPPREIDGFMKVVIVYAMGFGALLAIFVPQFLQLT